MVWLLFVYFVLFVVKDRVRISPFFAFFAVNQ